MKDTIIKGSRNSRSIIAASTVPEDWSDARAQLIQHGWPIDLGPMNPAGVEQMGDQLNKQTLLKDQTAALYGKDANAVPDDIFAAIKPLITTLQNSVTKFATGTYTGDGGTGTKYIYPGFAPKLFLSALSEKITVSSQTYRSFIIFGFGGVISYLGYMAGSSGSGIARGVANCGSISGSTVMISSDPGNGVNTSGASYRWIAIG